MTLQEIEAQLNSGTIEPDAQVWWSMETGDMIIASDAEMSERELSERWNWSYAGTVAEMVAANDSAA